MVINKINIQDLAFKKTKNDPPVSPYHNRPVTLQITLKGMEPKGRLIHSFNRGGGIKRRKDYTNARQHLRRELATVIVLIQSLQAFTSETLDHVS